MCYIQHKMYEIYTHIRCYKKLASIYLLSVNIFAWTFYNNTYILVFFAFFQVFVAHFLFSLVCCFFPWTSWFWFLLVDCCFQPFQNPVATFLYSLFILSCSYKILSLCPARITTAELSKLFDLRSTVLLATLFFSTT